MNHYYNARNTCLKELGLNPIYLNEEVLGEMFSKILKYKDRVKIASILPSIKWVQ